MTVFKARSLSIIFVQKIYEAEMCIYPCFHVVQ